MLVKQTMQSLVLGLGIWHASGFVSVGARSTHKLPQAAGVGGDRLTMALPQAKQQCLGLLHRARGGQLFQRRQAVAIPEVEVKPQETRFVAPSHPAEPEKKGLFNAYLRALDKKPMRTKIITSGVICGIGDIMAQALMFTQASGAVTLGKFVRSVELQRFSIYTFLGAFWIAPFVHYWFDTLESITKSPEGPPRTFVGRMGKALKMVTLDQSIGAPLVNAGMMFLFSLMTAFLADGIGMRAGKAAGVMVKDKLWGTMLTCWKVWPAANLINFAFVPAPLRVLFMNVVGLGWNIYLAGAVN